MSNGDSKAQTDQIHRFSILRTFSTVLPGKMARFMNAITWQAAWLRHFFHWDRVVVGYALTDVPERVLEVYGIPDDDIEGARRTLEILHAQSEYDELRKCCKGQREDDEELLPAMQFKTFLNGIVERLTEERALAERKRGADQELEVNREALKALSGEEERIASQRTRLAQQIDKLAAQIEVARRTNAGQTTGGQGLEISQGGVRVQSVESISQLERKKVALEEESSRLFKTLQKLSEDRRGLESTRNQKQEEVKGLTTEIQEARDPEKRKRKFADLLIPAYFLNVTIKVKPESLDEFKEKMKRLTEDFKWDFIAAGEHLPDVAFGEVQRNTGHEIMHLWKFGDANDLYRQMVELRENQRFSDIEKLTTQQTHMLMCDWEALSNTKRPPSFPELLA